MKKIKVNVEKLVFEFGGPRKMHLKLKKCGYEISESGIRKWIRRNSLPFHRFLEVMDTLQRMKHDMPPLSNFIQSEEDESY